MAKRQQAVGERIGFIGVGAMGGPMARRLLENGHAVVVHDTDPKRVAALVRRGAVAARSTRDVAAKCTIVFASLPKPAIVREVALGPDGITAGGKVRVFVDLSTTGAVVEKEVATGLARRRIALVDAPVSGGIAGAEKGTLAVLVAGDPRTVAKVRPLLDVFGKVFVAGEAPGQGQTLKLINNLLGATALAASAEAVVMGVKAGLDPDVMIEAINAGSGRNSATEDKIPKAVLTRTFDFGFPIEGYCKDVRLATEAAEALGVTLWVGGATKQVWHHLLNLGWGRRDLTAIVQHHEACAGVEVRGKAAARKPARKARG